MQPWKKPQCAAHLGPRGLSCLYLVPSTISPPTILPISFFNTVEYTITLKYLHQFVSLHHVQMEPRGWLACPARKHSKSPYSGHLCKIDHYEHLSFVSLLMLKAAFITTVYSRHLLQEQCNANVKMSSLYDCTHNSHSYN